MKKIHPHLYHSRAHVVATCLFVMLPFAYLALFSRFAGIGTLYLFSEILISSWRLLIAYLIAVVLAWILAVSLYRGRRAIIALPIFDILQSFPTSAALPLVTYFSGPSTGTVILFLTITVIWPILFSVISSLKLIRHDWREAVEISGLRGFSYVRFFLAPATINGLITGSIIGLGEGWEALVATEIIIHVKTGLGPFFNRFAQNPAMTTFGILGFLMIIFSINKLLWLPLLEWSHHRMEE